MARKKKMVEGSAAEEAAETPAQEAMEQAAGDHPVVHRPNAQSTPYPA